MTYTENHLNVIVGIDGCGKTSVLNALHKMGFAISSWHSIKNLPELEFMKKASDSPGKYRPNLPPLSRSIYVIKPVFAEYDFIIKPNLLAGNTVFVDSYYYRVIAKETIINKTLPDFLDLFNLLPVPSCVFLMDCDPEIAFNRKSNISQYECYENVTKDSFISFQKNVYDYLRKLIPPQIRIDISIEDESANAIALKILKIRNEIYG